MPRVLFDAHPCAHQHGESILGSWTCDPADDACYEQLDITSSLRDYDTGLQQPQVSCIRSFTTVHKSYVIVRRDPSVGAGAASAVDADEARALVATIVRCNRTAIVSRHAYSGVLLCLEGPEAEDVSEVRHRFIGLSGTLAFCHQSTSFSHFASTSSR